MIKKRIISVFIILIICLATTATYAVDVSNFIDVAKDATKSDIGDTYTKLDDIRGKTIAVVEVIGISVALIMSIALAVKYMTSAPNDRAEIKKYMIPYVIGVIFIFGAAGIIQIIRSFANDLENTGTAPEISSVQVNPATTPSTPSTPVNSGTGGETHSPTENSNGYTEWTDENGNVMGKKVLDDNSTEYYKNEQLVLRENTDGSTEYYKNEQMVLKKNADGSIEIYGNEQLVIENTDGSKEYYEKGQLASKENTDGSEELYEDGQLTMIKNANGSREIYEDGQLTVKLDANGRGYINNDDGTSVEVVYNTSNKVESAIYYDANGNKIGSSYWYYDNDGMYRSETYNKSDKKILTTYYDAKGNEIGRD